jgi:hypothetical protein
MLTNLGLVQSIFQGTPINTCLPTVGTSSACQWAEGRGNEVIFTRDPTNGNFVVDHIVRNARTPAYLQTDFLLAHEFGLSKSHENLRLRLSGNVYNLLNQHSAVGYNENANAASSQLISPKRGGELRFSGDPEVDWNLVMRPYNYADALNGAGAFSAIVQVPCVPVAGTASGATDSKGCTGGGTFRAGGFKSSPVQNPMTLSNRYGQANIFQTARQLRLEVHFIF